MELGPDDDQALREALRLIAAGGNAREMGTRELHRRFERRLLAFFVRNGQDRATAEELWQETMVSVVKHAASFRGEAKATTWLYQVAKNKLIDHTRRHNPELPLDEDGWAWVEANVVTLNLTLEPQAQSTAGALERCVQRMFMVFAKKEPQRAEALRQLVLEQLSTEEVAKWLGRTAHATAEYLSQTRKKFKPYLEECREFLAS